MSSWEKPYRELDSRNVTTVQKAVKLPNPATPTSARQRSAGSARTTSRTPRSWAR